MGEFIPGTVLQFGFVSVAVYRDVSSIKMRGRSCGFGGI